MDTLSYKTISANKSTIKREWLVIDASNQTLGRLSTTIAMAIRGKNKPSYTPHVNCGDHVIVLNADKVRMTGNKWDKKELISHTGYPGGQKVITPRQLKAKSSTLLVERAVRGMLPKNRLGRQLFKSLHVYAGTEHPHTAQQPKEIKL